MNKHWLYGYWHHLKNLLIIFLVMAFIISGGLGIYALRANNLKMLQLKSAVFSADQQNSNVAQALNNLRRFVYSHMNTSLTADKNNDQPPVQLVNSYNRAVKAAEATVANSSVTNQVYKAAEQTCLRQSDSSPSMDIPQCIQNYVTVHSNEIPQLVLPPKEDYMFSFVSPLWSPDLAGWSLVAMAIFGLMLIARLLTSVFMKSYLKS